MQNIAIGTVVATDDGCQYEIESVNGDPNHPFKDTEDWHYYRGIMIEDGKRVRTNRGHFRRRYFNAAQIVR